MPSVKKHLRLFALIFVFLANLFIWTAIFSNSSSELSVFFLDVGQGDAILIKAPGGNKMLIDAGPDRAVLKGLSSSIPFYDRNIEMILATHPDADHIGGFPAVLERYEVKSVIEPGTSSDTRIFESFEKALEYERAERIIARRGMEVDLGGGAVLTILFPDRDVSGVDSNDASVVGKLQFGETSFLLTGDAPIKIEEYLVSIDGENLKSDVLKAGHHGSKTSTSEIFVNAVSPEYVIISAGKDNKYGHPHQEALETLKSSQAKILSTYELDTILIKSDGNKLEVVDKNL
jgi:competence protein ComEC